jgi:hypothetical protein
MNEFFSQVSPRRAVADLWKVLGAPSEFRWRGMLLAAVASGSIIYGLVGHEERALPPLPKIIYINSWRADRSEAEIIAGNIAASRQARAVAAEEERRAADIRHMYKVVGAATGLDTEAMDKQGKAEREAEDRARAARARALLDRYLVKGEKPVVDPQAQSTAAPPSHTP